MKHLRINQTEFLGGKNTVFWVFVGNLKTTYFVLIKKQNNMEYPINQIELFSNEAWVKEFGVTEIFVFDGEIFTTSKYDLHYSYIQAIANTLNENGIECEA
jgi:hypothetical protein